MPYQSTSFKIVLFFSAFFVFFIFAPQALAFSCASNGAGGNFNVAGSWTSCNSTTPQTTDSITINNGATITLVAATTVTGITVNSGGILDFNTRAVIDNDNLTINSGGSITGTSATLSMAGSAKVIDGTGTYSPTGTITITDSTSFASTASLSFAGIVTVASGKTLTNNGVVTLTRSNTATLAGASGTFVNAATGTLNYQGTTITVGTFTATAAGNVVNYNNTGAAQTVLASTYDTLKIDDSGQVASLGGATTIQTGGTLNVNSGTLQMNTRNMTNNGTTTVTGTIQKSSTTGTPLFVGLITVASSGTWNTSDGNDAFEIRGGITNNSGTFTAGSGTFSFTTNNQNLAGAGNMTFGGTFAIASSIVITNNDTGTITVTGAATGGNGTSKWTQGANSTVKFGAAAMGTGTIDASTNTPNTVEYDGTATLKAVHYYNLTLDASAVVTSAAVTVDNNLTITAGTLHLVGSTFAVTGATSVSGTIDTATSATGTKAFNGAVTIATGGTFNTTGQNPVITFGAGITQSSANLMTIGTNNSNTLIGDLAGAGSGGITWGGNMAISSGTTSNGYTGGTVTVTGTLALTGNWAQANGSTLSLVSTTPFSGSGTFSASTATNTVKYSAAGTQALKDPNGGTAHTYSNLTVADGTTLTQGAFNLTVNNDFTVGGGTSGTYTASSSTITIGGNLTINAGATWTKSTGVITFGGSANTKTITDTPNADIGSVTVGDGSIAKVLQLGSTSSFTNLIVTNAATFSMTNSSYNLTLYGDLTLNSASTFTKETSGTGTLIFKGGTTQTITDSNASKQDLGAVQVSTTAAPSSGLIGYWKFDDGSGSSATDSSGNGNSGTLSAGATWTGSGHSGSAISFNGAGQVSMGSPALFDNLSSYTYTAWVKPNNIDSSNVVMSKSPNAGSGKSFSICAPVSDGSICANDEGWTAADANVTYQAGLANGTWYLLTATFDGTSKVLTVYKNTTLGDTATAAGTAPDESATNLLVGNGPYGFLNGVIDDPRLYNRALTIAEINDVYNAGNVSTVNLGSSAKMTSLTVDASQVFSANGTNTLTLTGSGAAASRPLIINGTFTPSTGTIAYTGTSATEITSTTYNNLSLIPAGAVTYTLGTAGSQTITVVDFTIGDGANAVAVNHATYDPTLNISGNFLISASAGTFTKSDSPATITFKPSGSKTWTDNTNQDIGVVVIGSGSSTPKITLGGTAKATSLTINASHELDLSTFTLSFTGTGTPFVATGTFTRSTGTIAYVPPSSSSVTVTNVTYHHVTFNSASSTFSLASALATDSTGNLTITAGTLDVTAAGCTGASCAVTVGGNWSNSGTFTPRTGTVTLNGTSQSVSGTTTFYNLSKTESANDSADEVLTFGASTTYTISHTLTLDGRDNNDRINLVSSSPGSRYTLDITGSAQTVDTLDITDSQASTNNITCDWCLNGGNNDDAESTPHWIFNLPLTQNAWRWYADSDDQNVTDPWPSGSRDLAENALLSVIPAPNNPPMKADELRARVNFTVGTAGMPVGVFAPKLQYGAGTTCSAVSSWTNVGAAGSGSIWRYASSSVTDGTTLTVAKLSGTNVLESYVKTASSSLNPNSATNGQIAEWDFHIEHNGAVDATTYCFRAVQASDSAAINTYSTYPQLETKPGTANLLRHGNVFIDGTERGASWAN